MPWVRMHFAYSTAFCWSWALGGPEPPPGISDWHACRADWSALISTLPSAGSRSCPLLFGSGKLGTPCERMQAANATAPFCAGELVGEAAWPDGCTDATPGSCGALELARTMRTTATAIAAPARASNQPSHPGRRAWAGITDRCRDVSAGCDLARRGGLW